MMEARDRVPSVSVIVPVFNKKNYVARAVRSALQQSFSDLEIVVVDDGSTDGSAEIVESFSDHRLRLIRQENGGVSAARNRGIRESKCDFLAFLDADDEWHADFLARMWALKEENPQASFFASTFDMIYDGGQRKTLDFGYTNPFPMDLLEFMDCCLRLKAPILPSTVMVSRQAIEKAGMFPVGQRRGEDLDTWVRLLFEGPVIYCNEPLMDYWYGLPQSACVTYQDVYLDGNQVLECLEEKIRQGVYRGKEKERVVDYIAWYKAGPVDRLIACGKCRDARRHILSSLRSRRLRKTFLLAYLKSLSPSLFTSLYGFAVRLMRFGKANDFFPE